MIIRLLGVLYEINTRHRERYLVIMIALCQPYHEAHERFKLPTMRIEMVVAKLSLKTK